MTRFFPTLTATKLQATTYLFGIALFSISFLVFLNSSISFVVTDVIGRKERVGDAVGTLGFADELLALLACPLWGLLSDRIGVRYVAVAGYCIVGISLILLVHSSNVYPQLLLGRLGFSVGAAACSTMVTAIMPSMAARRDSTVSSNRSPDRSNGHCGTGSVSSELTITPTRYSSSSSRHGSTDEGPPQHTSESQLAGFVGLFTGAGALVALLGFLPLPARFQENGDSPASSVQKSFSIVGIVALCVALAIFFGLRNLPGEKHKSITSLVTKPAAAAPQSLPLLSLVRESVKLGFTDSSIGLGYLGGFVARASSVGISLFVPLFVNAYFIRTGLCTSNPDNLTDIKEKCAQAYKLAAGLTGIAESAALLGAPLFGYFGGRLTTTRFQWPLMVASGVGILGYTGFGLVRDPDAFHGHGNSAWALVAVIALGISQIGAIVCSLALLSQGINAPPALQHSEALDDRSVDEDAPLLVGSETSTDIAKIDRSQLKGTIAGVYSLLGGAGILILTKAGGALFDSWTPGAPFFIMACFNALLLFAVLLDGLRAAARLEM